MILSPEAVSALMNLRKEYEARKGVNLSERDHFFGIPKVLGGTDTYTRKQQISFMEKILCIVMRNLLPLDEITSPLAFEANYTAIKMILAAYLFIRNEIYSDYRVLSEKRSALVDIMDTMLGINKSNRLDDNEKKICCETAARLIHLPHAFEEANARLLESKLSPFSEEEWKKFSNFVLTLSQTKPSDYNQIGYPVSALTAGFFGPTLGSAMAALGALSANTIVTSSYANGPHKNLAKFVGHGIVYIGVGSTFGVPFIAPVIASEILGTFLQIFLAKSLYDIGNKIGETIGCVVALPFDYALHLLIEAYRDISKGSSSLPLGLSGLRILDGKYVSNGVILEEQISTVEPEKNKIIFIEDNGTFRIGNETYRFDMQELMRKITKEFRHELRLEDFQDLSNDNNNCNTPQRALLQ